MSDNRNEPCACGSGRKAKNCCMRPAVALGKNNLLTIPPMDGAPARQVSVADAMQLAGMFIQRAMHQRARDIFQIILSADPENGEAMFFTGLVFHMEKQSEVGLPWMLRGVAKLPGASQLHYNLGKVYSDLQRYPEAIAAYRRALQINPKNIEAQCNVGGMLEHSGEYSQAIAAYRKAIGINPSHPEAHNNLGLILRQLGQFDEAMESFKRAIQAQPAGMSFMQNFISTMNYMPHMECGEIFNAHQRFGQQLELASKPFAARQIGISKTENARRLRIGYVSPDFKQHAVAHFIEPVLANHQKDDFEIFCYSNNPIVDSTTRHLQSLVPHWRDITGMTDQEAAKKIRDDGIDILVDLAGYTNLNRLMIFTLKPAPVQVTWIGYPNTTGLSRMDYRITDTLSDPIGQTEALHTEKLLRLPDCFSCFAPPKESPEVGPLPARNSGEIMFGSFNNLTKINDHVIATWARILVRMPGSRLTLKYKSLKTESIQDMVYAEFAKHGVTRDRLVFLSQTDSKMEHMSQYNRIDIGLDPFPYNGTTTTCDALWMGVPVITLAGRSHVGRVGVSQLTNIGLPELIGRNEDDYVDIAVALANDLPRLTALRSGLRERLRASPLMDAPRLTRNLEAAYREMWKNHIGNTT